MASEVKLAGVISSKCQPFLDDVECNIPCARRKYIYRILSQIDPTLRKLLVLIERYLSEVKDMQLLSSRL